MKHGSLFVLRNGILVGALFSSSAFAQYAINTPILTFADNFRDVAGIAAIYGGNGYSNSVANNGVMRTGVFYRANALALNAADLATVSKLGIGLVIDLRTPSEIQSKPDVAIPGATNININVLGSVAASPPMSSASANAAWMQGMNRAFVTDANQRAALRSVLLDLAHNENASIYHCTAGKDRTGWISAVLETVAGASSETVMKDYLASNTYSAKSIAATLAVLPASYRALYEPLLTVKASYLQAGLDQVVASYGSMYNYLTQGLGLTQADIYVLRAKMVNYLSLPGQAAFSGNAASGAATLLALQNSPLSGHYTAFNYYLQSAIDAGTLGGVEQKVGGQIHADAAAFLRRQPQIVDDSISTYINGNDIKPGDTRVWLTGIAGYLGAAGSTGIASSGNHNAGWALGATHRIAHNSSAYVGFASVWNSVDSAGGNANLRNYLGILGGRYAFDTLESGIYVDANVIAGAIDYQTSRSFGYGLGTASGSSNGTSAAFRLNLGNVIAFEQFNLIPQIGFRTAYLKRDAFNEQGSELALQMSSYSKTATAGLADITFELKPQEMGSWVVTPRLLLGYERAFNGAETITTGSLYGYSIGQTAAYDSLNLGKVGIGVTARNGALTLQAGANAMAGDGVKSLSAAAVNIGYSF